MGRYTSVQSFTDQKTKVVEGYKEAAGRAPAPARPEKVENVSGSVAGAGSCDFHLYRAARAREMLRIDSLESSKKDELERSEFAARVEENRREAEARTKKKAEKRKNRKQKKMLARDRGKQQLKDDTGVDDGSADESDESGTDSIDEPDSKKRVHDS